MSHKLNQFLRRHWTALVLFFVLLSVSAISAALVQLEQEDAAAAATKNVVSTITTDIQKTATTTPEPPPPEPENVYTSVDIFVSSSPPSPPLELAKPSEESIEESIQPAPTKEKEEKPPEKIGIAMLIDGDSSLAAAVPAGSTLEEAMTLLQTSGALTYETRDFGGSLGVFVESINGKANNPRENTYWFYSVNEKNATIGISHYTLSDHDVITWTYEKATL